MNKLHKCLYIVNLFKERGRLSRHDIETAMSIRYPDEPPLSDSTFKRYVKFIEESFSCFIDYDRSAQMYSLRFPANMSSEMKDTIDELLENERKSTQPSSNPKPFVYDANKMMLLAVRRFEGDLKSSPFIAQTMNDGIQKAHTFYGDTLEIVNVVTKREYGKNVLNFPVEYMKPIWVKGHPLVANTNLTINMGKLLNDVGKQQLVIQKNIESGLIDTKTEFEKFLNDKGFKELYKLCQDKEKYSITYEIFNLGILSTYSISEFKDAQTYLYNPKKAFLFCLDTAERLSKDFDKLIMLLFVEKDLLLMIFLAGMLATPHIIKKEK